MLGTVPLLEHAVDTARSTLWLLLCLPENDDKAINQSGQKRWCPLQYCHQLVAMCPNHLITLCCSSCEFLTNHYENHQACYPLQADKLTPLHYFDPPTNPKAPKHHLPLLGCPESLMPHPFEMSIHGLMFASLRMLTKKLWLNTFMAGKVQTFVQYMMGHCRGKRLRMSPVCSEGVGMVRNELS